MATLPNRYYNSPWIEQAARSLASALAPPDQKEQLALEEEQWKFKRLKELSAVEDQRRGEEDAGLASLGTIFANAGAKQVEPTSPGEAAYFSEHPELRGSAGLSDEVFGQHVQTALKGRIPITQVEAAAGPRGAGFLSKLALADDKQLAALGLTTLKGQQAWDRSNLTVDGAMARAILGYDKAMTLSEQNALLQKELARIRGEQQVTHDASVNARPGTDLDVSPTEGRNMGYNIEDYFSNLVGNNLDDQPYKLPGDVQNAVTDYANYLYPKTRNSSVAEQQAREFFFGPNPRVTKADAPYFGWNTEASVALRDGKTLDELLKELRLLKAGAPPSLSTVVTQDVAAAPTTPAGASGVPAGIARQVGDSPGTEVPVMVRSVEEAMLLAPNTLFMINGGPRNGEIHRTPAR